MHLHARTIGLDLLGEGQLRESEQLGEHRRDHSRAAVIGLGRADHEIRLLGLDRRGERPCGQERVGSRKLGIRDQHTAVGAHRQPFADRILRPLGTHRHEHDLAAVSFLELKSLFDSAFVAYFMALNLAYTALLLLGSRQVSEWVRRRPLRDFRGVSDSPLSLRQGNNQIGDLFQRLQAGVNREIVIFGAHPIMARHLVEVDFTGAIRFRN